MYVSFSCRGKKKSKQEVGLGNEAILLQIFTSIDFHMTIACMIVRLLLTYVIKSVSRVACFADRLAPGGWLDAPARRVGPRGVVLALREEVRLAALVGVVLASRD